MKKSAIDSRLIRKLGKISDPISGGKLTKALQVVVAQLKDGTATIVLEVPPQLHQDYLPYLEQWRNTILELAQVNTAQLLLTARRDPQQQASPFAQAPKPEDNGSGQAAGPTIATRRSRPAARQPPPPSAREKIPTSAKFVLAVASGKGGVGKSMTAAQLALAMARAGRRVGLLDADVYGPSVPRLFAVTEQPISANNKILPIIRHGVKLMSIGFMVAEDVPMIWRGPMVMSAIEQMLRDVAWDDLDILLLDLPPGTGDAQLTISQRTTVHGAVVVTTPQQVALSDVKKAIQMFNKVDISVLGIIDNMSYFDCATCGSRHYPFGQGQVEAVAKEYQTKILLSIPITAKLAHDADHGALIDTDQALVEQFDQLATNLFARLQQ